MDTVPKTPDTGQPAGPAPADDALLLQLAECVQQRREHPHPQGIDYTCLHLASYMGERMANVLKRLTLAEAEAARLRAQNAELVELLALETSDGGAR